MTTRTEPSLVRSATISMLLTLLPLWMMAQVILFLEGGIFGWDGAEAAMKGVVLFGAPLGWICYLLMGVTRRWLNPRRSRESRQVDC